MAKRRLIHAVNEALHEEMERDDRVILYGEDVRIGLFGDTRGLFDKFGGKRVINTPISEVVMTGMAVGMAAAGYRPICHMMYGNFLYTGFDSIANQAAKLRYMTAGQLKLPLVYLASTGAGRSSGAQHSDAPYPGVMNLGGIKVVIPSTPADAKGLMKASIREDNPVLFLLPTRRGGEQGEVPDGDHVVPLGKGSVKREGRDVTVVAIGVMVRHAMRAAATLSEEGIEVEVVDPMTLFPLDKELILASVRKTGRLVILDEARATCSAASEIAAIVAEQGFASLRGPVGSVAKIVKLEHAWRRLDGRNDDGFQVAPFPG
ncbi:alpha-ketoacid dehydrogenase subunit beta [Sphingobium ummariense]|uniref:Pyruvate dehydrogenase subunit beta n=1 Tax=Sphingobium ummariense RL-3 TaxID=1346791 RepID=T0IPA3_9SPHN|nr:transketolase C-terminal domain-containing protein [Sphingobium ummariense]EQB30640.1 pyruvate dehydrogenase subunit beta [Sphingobium ummariense RL-3]